MDEGEGEGVEHPGRAQPDVLVPTDQDVGLKLLAAKLSDRAVDTVTGHDQIGAQLVRALDLALELDPHAESQCALDQDVEQPLAADAGAVPAPAHRLFVADGQ